MVTFSSPTSAIASSSLLSSSSSSTKDHPSNRTPTCESRAVDPDLYASSISSSDTSPSPVSTPFQRLDDRHTQESNMRRPDSPRLMTNDATALAKARLRQLVVWSDAAEEARDVTPVEVYLPTDDNSPLKCIDSNHNSQQPQPQQHQQQHNQKQTPSSFQEKLKQIHSATLPPSKPTSVCNMEFPLVPSSPTCSTSSEEDENDELNRRPNEHVCRLSKLEQELIARKKSQDRVKPSPWSDNISADASGLMRRKSFFNGRKPTEQSSLRRQSVWWGGGNPSSPSNNEDFRRGGRNCYSTGYTTSTTSFYNNSSTAQYNRPSSYGHGYNRSQSRCSARRPQSFHRYARIVPDYDCLGKDRTKTSNARSNHDMDEFDDLIDGLHATKVTETPLQPSA